MNVENNTRYKKTHAKIISTFIKLISNYGIDNISVLDIVEKSGISNKTFYSHFNSKKELLEEIEIEHLSKIKAAYAETHSDYNEGSIFIPLLSHIKENRKLFIWLLSEFDYDYRKRSIGYVYEKYFKPLCENLYDNELHKMYCFIGFHSSLVSCLKYWLERDCPESEEEIAAIIVECIPEKLREPALEGNDAEQN